MYTLKGFFINDRRNCTRNYIPYLVEIPKTTMKFLIGHLPYMQLSHVQ